MTVDPTHNQARGRIPGGECSLALGSEEGNRLNQQPETCGQTEQTSAKWDELPSCGQAPPDMDSAGAQEEQAGDEEGDGDGEQQDTAKVSPVLHRIRSFLDRQTMNESHKYSIRTARENEVAPLLPNEKETETRQSLSISRAVDPLCRHGLDLICC